MRIACFGSLNIDLAVRLPHLPAPDETVLASGLSEHLGGKGANQATAAARLDAIVAMVGAVGTDAHGDTLLAGLERNGVDHRHVERRDGPSGTALINVADDGRVTIVVVPGANGLVGPETAERAVEALRACDVLLLQGEVPVQASVRAAELARAGGAIVVANPAPVGPDSSRLIKEASLIVLNEGEAAALGLSPSSSVVVTLGSAGALVGDRHVPAFPAPAVVDATGAGDAFCGALAVALARGTTLEDAVRQGCAAGSWAVRHLGAEPSLPTCAQLDSVLAGG
jgi:ribokinase